MKLLYPQYNHLSVADTAALMTGKSLQHPIGSEPLPSFIGWQRIGNYQTETYVMDPVLLRLFSCEYLNAELNLAVTDPDSALKYVLNATDQFTSALEEDDDLADEDDWEDDDWMDDEADDDEGDDDEDFEDDDLDDEDFEDLEDEDWENDFVSDDEETEEEE